MNHQLSHKTRHIITIYSSIKWRGVIHYSIIGKANLQYQVVSLHAPDTKHSILQRVTSIVCLFIAIVYRVGLYHLICSPVRESHDHQINCFHKKQLLMNRLVFCFFCLYFLNIEAGKTVFKICLTFLSNNDKNHDIV